jgi:membrane fusion protein (multidrug efflux system)
MEKLINEHWWERKLFGDQSRARKQAGKNYQYPLPNGRGSDSKIIFMKFNKYKKYFAWSLLAIPLLLIFLWHKHYTAQAAADAAAPPATVAIAKATEIIWHKQIHVVGSTKAAQGVDISSQVSGVINQINFQSGQSVKAGDLLVTLESGNEQAALESSQAKLILAQNNYQRYMKLYNKKVISPSDLDNMRSQLNQAQANVHQAQALLAQKFIRAPFSGALGISQINLGQYISPGQVMVNLQMIAPLFVDCNVPEKFLKDMRVGAVIKFTTASEPGQIFAGEIIALSAAIDVNTRSLSVRAEVPNQDKKLLPGMFVNVELPLGRSDRAIAVPQTAVGYSPSGEFIFVVQQNKAHMRYVHVGEQYGNSVIILDGVKAGEQVVTAGQLNLYEGATVKIGCY